MSLKQKKLNLSDFGEKNKNQHQDHKARLFRVEYPDFLQMFEIEYTPDYLFK